MTFSAMLLMPFLIQLRRKMWGPQFIMMSLDDGNVKPTELTDFQIPRFLVMWWIIIVPKPNFFLIVLIR